jgi:adenylyltransferase/sulfurtransferase
MMDHKRYMRQVVLPEIGNDGQNKLSCAKILCVGAGGLGSPALLYLAAAGIGCIGIADFDIVDESNLQRQILYTTEAVGEAKVQQAKERLQALNPDIDIITHDRGLKADNAAELFQAYDIILDGTDNFETKFLINDAAVKYGKPWVYGAIQGFDGQASIFNASNGPCYRCLYPHPPKARIANCAESGVIGAVAGIIGVTQALQAIQIIVKHDSFNPLLGKLWTLDTKTMQSQTLNIAKNQSCPACSQNPEDITLSFKAPICSIVAELSTEQLRKNSAAHIIDVREQSEWQKGHIENAQHWALSGIMDGKFPDISHDAEIILYCQKGMRSKQAAQILKENGYKHVYSLTGGYESWLHN